MTIQPTVFSLVFSVIGLGIGVDFTISGIRLLRENAKHLEKPKLLGLLILRLNQRSIDAMRKHNQIYRWIYSDQNLKFFILAAGILIIIGSLIQIIDILY